MTTVHLVSGGPATVTLALECTAVDVPDAPGAPEVGSRVPLAVLTLQNTGDTASVPGGTGCGGPAAWPMGAATYGRAPGPDDKNDRTGKRNAAALLAAGAASGTASTVSAGLPPLPPPPQPTCCAAWRLIVDVTPKTAVVSVW